MKEKLNNLPEKSGVYIFKDKENKIIYIGKAKNIKKRVSSYFQKTKKDFKTYHLVEKIKNIDFIITKNELEAFMLENTLIKEHKPKYNIMLKDDKTYPFIKITIKEKYPGIYLTRNTKDKTSIYFGPYFAGDAKKVLNIIYKIFKIRQCKLNLEKELKRPCIYYDINMCSGPCVRKINEKEYMDDVKETIDFLKGDYKKILKNLETQMQIFSNNLQFERAAEIRDQISSIKEIMNEQKVVDAKEKNVDVLDYVYINNTYYCGMFLIRNGRLVNKTIKVFKDVLDEENQFESFILQHYSKNILYPDTIIIDKDINISLLQESVFKNKVKIMKKKKDKLLDMLKENILEKIKQDKVEKEREIVKRQKIDKQLLLLKNELNLKNPVKYIDGIDISHLFGENMVGSCVVFKDGMPCKNMYRRYKIKTINKIDDFSAIYEVVKRRYTRLKNKGEELPDLIIIDGGIGQVNIAKRALNELNIDITVIGIAKKEEEIFLSFNSTPIKISKEAKFLIQQVRDEAHRFAISYQTLLKNKKLKTSILDDIKFLGEKTKQRIYNEYNDLNKFFNDVKENKINFLNKKQKNEILKYIKDNNL